MKKEDKVQKVCATHNQFESFKCYTCGSFLCPACLKSHEHKNKLVRAEIIGHFISYYDSSYSSNPFTIWTYDVSVSKLVYKDLNFVIYNQVSIYIQYMVYLTGGLDSMTKGVISKAYDDVYQFDTRLNDKLIKKANMPTPKAFNALCTVTDEEIYSIGGKNQGGYLNTCEKYDIAKDTWVTLKPISVARGNVGLGIYDCKTIYCIGGHCEQCSEVIESLDTSSEANIWVTIVLSHKGDFDARSSSMIVQDPIKDKLIIFGGCCDIGITKEIFIFDVKEKTMTTLPKLKLMKAAAFLQRSPVLWNDCYYLFEYGKRCGIYKYSLKEETVSRIRPRDYIEKKLWEKKIKLI